MSMCLKKLKGNKNDKNHMGERPKSGVGFLVYCVCAREEDCNINTRRNRQAHICAVAGWICEIDTECLSLPAAKKRAAYILRRLFELFNQEN